LIDPLHQESLTVQVITQGAPDENGIAATTVTETTYGPAATPPTPGYNVQPVISTRATEGLDNQLLVTERYKVSGPPIPGITAASKIIWRGKAYMPWGDPTPQHVGILPHAEFFLIAWSG